MFHNATPIRRARASHCPVPTGRRAGKVAMAPLYGIALVIMQPTLHPSYPVHFGERLATTVGLIASCSGLLSLLSCGLGWAAITEFFWLWLGLGIGASPLGLLVDRSLRFLFWLD